MRQLMLILVLIAVCILKICISNYMYICSLASGLNIHPSFHATSECSGECEQFVLC